MSSTADHALTLPDLPSDIVRIIVRMALQESFEGMRLISHRWNNIGLDLLRDRKLLPAMDSLELCIASDGETVHSFKIIVPNDYLRFLGLENCKRERIGSDFSKSLINMDHAFLSPMDEEWFLNHLTILLNRCSSITKFDFNGFDLCKEEIKVLDTVTHILGGIAVQELKIRELRNLNDHLVCNVLKILRALSVDHLLLTIAVPYHLRPIEVFRSNIEAIASMISESLSHVNSIVLYDASLYEEMYEGLNDDEWEQYANDLSQMTNLDVTWNAKWEKSCDIMRYPLTAQKPAAQ